MTNARGAGRSDLDPEGLRAIRDRKAWLSTRAGLASKAIMMVVRFLSVPLSLRLLGTERYGLWMAVWSFLNWFGLSDVGLGMGLLNALGNAAGRGDRDLMRRHISTVVYSVGVVSGALLALIMVVSQWSGLEAFLGVGARPDLAGDARAMVLAGGVTFALTFALNAIGQICTGLQEAYLAAAASTLGSLLAVICMAVLVYSGSSITTFVLAVGLPPIMAYVGLAVYLFGWRHSDLRPRLASFSRGSMATLFRTGGPAVFIQLGAVAISQTPRWMISNRLGPSSVTPFVVTYSLLYFGYAAVANYSGPLWPAYAEAATRRDWEWIRRRYGRSLAVVAAAMGAFSVGMMLLGELIIRFWAGQAATPPWALLAAMSCYFWIWSLEGCVSALLNGLGLFRLQAITVTCSGLMFAGMSWWFIPRVGTLAVPMAGVASMSLEIIFNGLFARRYLRDQEGVRALDQDRHPAGAARGVSR